MIRFFRTTGIVVVLLLAAGCAAGRLGHSWGIKLQILTLEITERQLVGVRIASQDTNSTSNNFPDPTVNPIIP